MTIPTIVAISRSALGDDERASFGTKSEADKVAFLLSWDPAVQGVHPGESVFIYAVDFNISPGSPTFTVQPVGCTLTQDLTIIGQESIFSDGIHDYVQIEVRLPAFEQLQSCDSYTNNPIMMWLQFKVKNNMTGEQSLDSIPIIVWKPWPVIVAISRSPLWDEQKPGDQQKQINVLKGMNDVDRAAYLIKRDPAALGVYPGDSIFIYVLDFNSGTQGREYRVSPVLLNLAEGLEVEGQDTILTDQFRTYVQIQVRVPTLDQLELSKNYERNALMMGLQFQVENPFGGMSWNSLPILVWTPWPQVKVWDWDTTVKVGTPPDAGSTSGSGTTGTEITRHLGRPADGGGDTIFGQVRWYPVKDFGIPELPAAPDFINLEKTFGPDGKLVVVMPPGFRALMHKIRDKGTYIRHDLWTDSYVQFDQPSDPDQLPGVAILWRDDLPSRPIIDIIELANQLWRTRVNIPMQDAEYPVPLGQVFTLGVDQLVDAANNLLAHCLGEGTISVSFAYQYKPYGASNSQFDDLVVDNGPKECIAEKTEDLVHNGGLAPGGVGLSGLALSLRVRPKVYSSTPLPEQCGPFTIQLSARIVGQFFGKPVDLTINIGLPLVFRPEPLVLPTMAVFFTDPQYNGAPLVMFPKDMFGMPAEFNNKHYDDRSKMISPKNDQGAVVDWAKRWELIKAEIGTKLGVVLDGLKILKTFGIVPYADAIIGILGRIQAATRLVFNSTGYVADLGRAVYDYGIWEILGWEFTWDDKSFGRSISSAILVGVPNKWSKIVVNCYEDVKKGGRKLELGIPGNHFVAAVADMRAMGDAYPLFGFDVALPYVKGPSGVPPFEKFDDTIASIEIVAQ